MLPSAILPSETRECLLQSCILPARIPTATTFSTTTAAKRTPTSTTSRLLGFRFVDRESTTMEFRAVEALHRRLDLLVRCHFDKSKSARLACHFIHKNSC